MDRHDPSSRPRLPGPGEPGTDEARAAARDRGLRQVSRLSNWTAAALLAVTGITAGYFAHTAARAPLAATTTGVKSQAPGVHQPCVSAPVAISGGSGVVAPAPVKSSSSCAASPAGTRPPVVYADSAERGDQ
jgi:hypothetical protein